MFYDTRIDGASPGMAIDTRPLLSRENIIKMIIFKDANINLSTCEDYTPSKGHLEKSGLMRML
jgi:hypothetical protein